MKQAQGTEVIPSTVAPRAVILLPAVLLAAVDVGVKAAAVRELADPVSIGPLDVRVGYNPA